MTTTEALMNPELKAMIEAAEDIWVSLDNGDRSDPVLENLLNKLVEELNARGVDYRIN